MDLKTFLDAWKFGTIWVQRTTHWVHVTLGYLDCTPQMAEKLLEAVDWWLHTELPENLKERLQKVFKPRETKVWVHSNTRYAGGRFPIVDMSDEILDKLVDAEEVPDITWETEYDVGNRDRYH